MSKFTQGEKRAIRRELINNALHAIKDGRIANSLEIIKYYVRRTESKRFGYELRAYASES